METKKRNKFLTILMTAIAVSLLLICCYANLLPQEQLTRMTPYSFTDDWMLSSREETRMVALGEDFHVQGNTLHLFRRLPEFLNADDVLMFRTSLIALSAKIDGKEIYHYDGTGTLQSLTMPYSWQYVDLSPTDAGKVLTLDLSWKDNTVVYIGDLYLDSGIACQLYSILEELPFFLLSVSNLFYGGYLLLNFNLFKNRRYYRADYRLLTLGMAAIQLGIWDFYQGLSGRVLVAMPDWLSWVGLSALWLLPVTLVCYLNEAAENRSIVHTARLLFIYYIAFYAAVFIATLTGVPAMSCVILQHLNMIVLFVCIMRNQYVQIVSNGVSSGRLISFALVVVNLMVFAADFVIYHYHTQLRFGLLSTMACMGYIYHASMLINGELHAKAAEAVELQISAEQQKAAMMLSQIRPHFIYNVLNTIRCLCVIDAAQAETAIVDFSEYLRSDMNFLEKQELIPFSEEAAHTRNYLKLESMRFGKRLRVRWVLEEEDFLIPPLLLQPIVENAVRYGVTKKTAGGEIQIRSFGDTKNIYVTVRDDGNGFDARRVLEDPAFDGELHIGIHNVRTRLQINASGDLQIKSTPTGTLVTLILPRKRS